MGRIAILAGGIWWTIYSAILFWTGRTPGHLDPDSKAFLASLALSVGLLMILAASGVLDHLRRTKWFRGQETRCRKCGYILHGLTEPRCSECGERI